MASPRPVEKERFGSINKKTSRLLYIPVLHIVVDLHLETGNVSKGYSIPYLPVLFDSLE
jgi:hypothetical protein